MAARALLSVDRALLCQLDPEDAVLHEHPLPYRAVAWIVSSTPAGVFIGNPRVHYQHLAARVRGPREGQRRWRAWAAWHLVRLARPNLPGDARHAVVEPDFDSIREGLAAHGIAGEIAWWQAARADALVRSARLYATGPAPGAAGG
jgi:hypothetical protein